jgi:3-dehydroquinate synthase
VLADIATLATLPARERRTGYDEIVKYGLIDRPDFFAWLEANGPALLAGEPEPLAEAIRTSCEAKAAIVAADEKESGARALLNLGHTFGHALEAETGMGQKTQLAAPSQMGEAPARRTASVQLVRADSSTDATNQLAGAVELMHGEAVAIGMQMAFDFSVHTGLCPPADAQRLRAHLTAVELRHSPLQIRLEWDVDRLMRHFRQDKKVADGKLTFILARGIGKAFITQDIDESALRAFLQAALR